MIRYKGRESTVSCTTLKDSEVPRKERESPMFINFLTVLDSGHQLSRRLFDPPQLSEPSAETNASSSPSEKGSKTCHSHSAPHRLQFTPPNPIIDTSITIATSFSILNWISFLFPLTTHHTAAPTPSHAHRTIPSPPGNSKRKLPCAVSPASDRQASNFRAGI
jgi:hypothetical protein